MGDKERVEEIRNLVRWRLSFGASHVRDLLAIHDRLAAALAEKERGVDALRAHAEEMARALETLTDRVRAHAIGAYKLTRSDARRGEVALDAYAAAFPPPAPEAPEGGKT